MDPLAALGQVGGIGDPSMSYMSPFGGIGAAQARLGMDPMGMMGQMGQQSQLQQYLLGMLLGLMVGQMAQQQQGAGGGGCGTGGDIAPGGLAGVPLFNNGGSSSPSGSTGSSSPSGSTSSAGSSAPSGPSGSDAVEIGRRYLGQNAIDIKGKMPHFTAAGGQTNNCADFVSSCLEGAGKLQGHHVNVKEMEKALIKQGWRQVPASQSKPGDVWMNHSRGHVELVTQAGGTRTIGSNNDRPGHQVISERAKDPNSGVYYTKG